MAEEHDEGQYEDRPAASPVSNPQYLGNVIAQAYTQAVQDKSEVYGMLARKARELPDAVMNAASSFYFLWDLSGHYMEEGAEEDFRRFFEEELLTWENSSEDDEDEYHAEAADKAKRLLDKFGEYKHKLRDAGLLTLVQRYEEGG